MRRRESELYVKTKKLLRLNYFLYKNNSTASKFLAIKSKTSELIFSISLNGNLRHVFPKWYWQLYNGYNRLIVTLYA
jgi:Holliday junction resolvase